MSSDFTLEVIDHRLVIHRDRGPHDTVMVMIGTYNGWDIDGDDRVRGVYRILVHTKPRIKPEEDYVVITFRVRVFYRHGATLATYRYIESQDVFNARAQPPELPALFYGTRPTVHLTPWIEFVD